MSWHTARRGESQGVGDVMEAIVLGRVRLSLRTTLFRSLASWLAIAFGGSIYGLRELSLRGPAELVLFAGLGVLAAAAARALVRLLSWGEEVRVDDE